MTRNTTHFKICCSKINRFINCRIAYGSFMTDIMFSKRKNKDVNNDLTKVDLVMTCISANILLHIIHHLFGLLSIHIVFSYA